MLKAISYIFPVLVATNVASELLRDKPKCAWFSVIAGIAMIGGIFSYDTAHGGEWPDSRIFLLLITVALMLFSSGLVDLGYYLCSESDPETPEDLAEGSAVPLAKCENEERLSEVCSRADFPATSASTPRSSYDQN